MENIRAGLADEEVNIFFGTTVKPHLGDEIRVTLIASINADEFKTAIETPVVPERIPTQEPQEAPAEETEEVLGDDLYDEEEDEVVAPVEDFDVEEVPDAEPLVYEEDESFAAQLLDEPEEDVVPTFAPQPAMHQPELMPTRPLQFEDDEDDMPPPHSSTAKSGPFFSAGGPPGRYPMPGRRRPVEEDDLDTPPSLDFNDLRGLFPRN